MNNQKISSHNPEVVGSSPASATIKTTAFAVVFFVYRTFRSDLKAALFSFWAIFGPLGQKTHILGHRLGRSRAAFLCLLPEQHIRNTL